MACAETIEPVEGKNIDLGTLSGMVYYDVEPMVLPSGATLGADTPVRFIAMPAREQLAILSTPRGVGELLHRCARCAAVTNYS